MEEGEEGEEMKGSDTLFSHKGDEWETPQWLFDRLNAEFHFDLDAACTVRNCKCKCGIFECDALIERWDWYKRDNLSVFLNPPYSRIGAFMKKAYEESLKGITVVCLIPCRTDTKYWHDYVMKAEEIRFIKGRLKFTINGVDNGSSAPFPSCVVVFTGFASSMRFPNPHIGVITK